MFPVDRAGVLVLGTHGGGAARTFETLLANLLPGDKLREQQTNSTVVYSMARPGIQLSSDLGENY